MFSSFRIEGELRRHPEILVNQRLWGSWSRPMIATSGFCVGAVAGAAIGGGTMRSMWGASLVGWLSGFLYASYTHSKTEFDVDLFLQDLWELASPRIPPQQKLDWIAYIWRFYDLQDILCRGASLS